MSVEATTNSCRLPTLSRFREVLRRSNAWPLSRERRPPRHESSRLPRAARRLQRLVRRRTRLYIEGMNVAFELPPAQAEKLRQAAEQLGISPSELARAAVTDLLAERDDDFRKAAERVLRKNADLYRRLA